MSLVISTPSFFVAPNTFEISEHFHYYYSLLCYVINSNLIKTSCWSVFYYGCYSNATRRINNNSRQDKKVTGGESVWMAKNKQTTNQTGLYLAYFVSVAQLLQMNVYREVLKLCGDGGCGGEFGESSCKLQHCIIPFHFMLLML